MVTDNEAPSTTADVQKTYSTPGIIQLTADDGQGAGVAATYYTLDGSDPIAATILGTGGTGAHTLQYWSVDVLGNLESRHTATYTVGVADKTAPVTTSNAQATYSGIGQISLTAVDAGGTGVAHTYYRMDGGAIVESTFIGVSGVGKHTIEFWSVDAAGNTEAINTVSYTVAPADVVAPTTTSDALSAYTGTATVSLTATDNAGGLGVSATYYRVDGGSLQNGLVIVVAPPTDGLTEQHAVDFWSVDAAGNVEGTQSVTFTIATPNDSVAPTTLHDGVAAYTGQATISLTAADNLGGAGVNATYYRIDGGAQQSGTQIVVAPPASGTQSHTITFWSVDNAGNREADKTFTFSVTAAQVGGTADLVFYWLADGSGQAQCHIEDAATGVTVAQRTWSGSGGQMIWTVPVTAGKSYKMVCDYGYDEYNGQTWKDISLSTGVVRSGQAVYFYY
jgi:hypothetical protein